MAPTPMALGLSLLLCRPYGVRCARRWARSAESKESPPAPRHTPLNTLAHKFNTIDVAPTSSSPKAKHFNPSAVALLWLRSASRVCAMAFRLATAAPCRPCQKPFARPCTFPIGRSAGLVAIPLRGFGVRPPCVRCPLAPSPASIVRTEAQS